MAHNKNKKFPTVA